MWIAGWTGAEINLIMTNNGTTIFSSFLKNCSFVLTWEEIAKNVKHMSQVYMPKLFALYPRVTHVRRRHNTVA
jgi:hypothetical protein